MAKAIFTKTIGYTSMEKNVGWHAEASPDPQSFPEEFIAYAESVGAATRVEAKAVPAKDAAK